MVALNILKRFSPILVEKIYFEETEVFWIIIICNNNAVHKPVSTLLCTVGSVYCTQCALFGSVFGSCFFVCFFYMRPQLSLGVNIIAEMYED